MPGPLDVSEAGPLDITYPPDGIPRSTPSSNSVGTAAVIDNAVTEAKLATAVQDKINRILQSRTLPIFSTDFLAGTNSNSFDPFVGSPVSTGTVNQPSISSLNHPGIVRILSSTSANSGYLISSNLTQIQIGGGEFYDLVFYIDALANNTTRFGFIDTATSADVTDGAYIEIDSSGVVTGKAAAASARTSTGTTGTVVAATWYRATIEVNAAGTLVTYTLYSDAGAVLWTNTIATNIPTTGGQLTGVGFIITNALTSAITLAHLDYMAFYMKRSLVRGGV